MLIADADREQAKGQEEQRFGDAGSVVRQRVSPCEHETEHAGGQPE